MTTKRFLVLWGFILGFQNIVTLSNAQTTILSEGFEGAFPGSWSVGDSNPSGTTAYWGKVDYIFGTFPILNAGNWYGYCAGVGYGGTSSNPNYQNSMNAYMSRSIDLRGYSAATLSFWYVIPSIEFCLFPPCDYLHVLIDGTEVFYRDTAQTTWNQVSVDLTAYVGGTHTLKFEFVSDGSFTHEGAYLDDILVSGQIKPDLQIPNYQFKTTTVTEGNPFWVQARIYNAGTSMADLSHVQLYLSTDNDFGVGDDYYVSPQMSFGPLAPGASQWVRWDFTVPDIGSGNYSVWPVFVLETDPSNPLKGNVPWTASDPPPPQTSFGGTVLDSSSGNGIPGATVQWGALSRTADGSGFYSFDLVPCGSAALTVTKYGYQTSSQSYTPICLASQVKSVSLTPGLSGNAVGADTFAGQVSPVFIQRFPIPSRIDPTKPTWIVIHGRNTSSTSASIVRLAQAISSERPNDQVLTLDWSAAAQDPNNPADPLFLTHEDWIQPVAQWAATALMGYGFSGLSLNVVGHSWGGNMTDELAERISGGVNTIVALDPAENGLGSYNPEDPGQIDFAAHSQFSWAFHSSCDGSESTPNSADEAIFVNTGLNTVDGSAHNAVVSIFSFMLENSSGGVSHLFKLNRLANHELGPWIPNEYSPYFGCESPATSYEAILTAASDGQSPYSIRYVDSATFQEITVLETADTISPTISAFSVSPDSVVVGYAFTISYKVSDTGGSGLNRVVLRRTSGDGSANDPGWQDIRSSTVTGNGPVSGSFNDAPSGPGNYWYGMAVFDNSGNSQNERQAGLGPLQRTVNISVTVQPIPSGRSFSVDGTTYTTAQTFAWGAGLSHTIATASPQSGSAGTQYVWSDWSDGGAISHTVNPTSGTTYDANFTPQYYLTMSAATGGAVDPSSGWNNSGASVPITATANDGFTFSNWTGTGDGSYSGSSSSTSVTMNGPITETASFTATPVCTVTAGLVAYYPFNGNANDESGNGHDGTAINGVMPTTDRFGTVDGAFSFDGVGGYVGVPDSADQEPANLTVAGWFYLSMSGAGAPCGEYILASKYGAAYDGWILRYGPSVTGDPQKVAFSIHRQPNLGANAVSALPLSLNTWVHLAGTYDGDTIRIYTNGVEAGNAAFPGGYTPTVTPMWIGAADWAGACYMPGRIADFRVYNRAVSPSEIQFLTISRPTLLSSPRMTDNGGFVFTLIANAGCNYRIEATTSLPATSWTALTTVFNIAGPVQITNFNASSFSRRFYRAVLVP
jgi:hypothetical protein